MNIAIIALNERYTIIKNTVRLKFSHLLRDTRN